MRSMNLGQLQIYSPTLQRHVSFSFRLPSSAEAGPGPYPALLLLHGAEEDHTAWLTRTMLPVHLEGTPLIAIMPDGARSQWLNRNAHERYEDFLIHDLLPACEAFFPVRAGHWAIGGLSMGGQGALHLGLKYPTRFASIYAHSSVIPDRETLHRWLPELNPETLADADLYERVRHMAARPERPALSFDCGTEDPLLEENRAFHRHLQRIGYPHRYAEHPGGHTWHYWDEHVREALSQHLAVLAP